LQRHTSAKQRPDPIIIAEFDSFVEPILSEICSSINGTTPSEDEFMMDYPSSQTDWTDAKRNMYESNILGAFYDINFTEYYSSFRMMTKAAEIYKTLEI
jgi:hypothetical protein